MIPRLLTSISVFTLLAALASPIRLVAQNNGEGKRAMLVVFDAPGAGTGFDQGTFEFGLIPEGRITGHYINTMGTITGHYIDANRVYQGFVRASDGAIAHFDVPGAGTNFLQGTFAMGINPAGTITGYSIDANGAYHSYMRASDGTITQFDFPGAGTGPSSGTLAMGINPCGYDHGILP